MKKTGKIKKDMILSYLERKKISLTQLAIELRITRQALYNAMSYNKTSREMVNRIAIYCARNKEEYNQFFIQHQLIPSQYQNLCKNKPAELVEALSNLKRSS